MKGIGIVLFCMLVLSASSEKKEDEKQDSPTDTTDSVDQLLNHALPKDEETTIPAANGNSSVTAVKNDTVL